MFFGEATLNRSSLSSFSYSIYSMFIFFFQFSMDMLSEAVKRVEDVRALRAAQVRPSICSMKIKCCQARKPESQVLMNCLDFLGPQFPQDNSPMAHPIRPESYIAMDNFYTATVYSKGAEVRL